MSSRSLNVTVVDVRQREKYVQCLQRLSKVMDVVQIDDTNIHGKNQEKFKIKLLDEVQKIFDYSGLKIFSETLFRMMVIPFQSKDGPFVTKVIEFFYDIICDDKWGEATMCPNDTVSTVSSLNGSLIEDGGTESLPMRILRLCERYHDEGRAILRLRILQTVARIIPDQISIPEIRRTLQMKLVKMLLMRLRDKSDQVRVLSARNLCLFSEHEVPFETQIFDQLIQSMKYDPEHLVRAKIVSCIKINDDTLEHVVERTGDPNAIVRTAAIKRVSESIPLTSLSIEMREAILKANITDDAPKHVEKAIAAMLESWLTCLKDDPCEFLRVLNVRKRAKLCYTALNSLYSQVPEEAFMKMSTPVLNDRHYPEESLCIESTYLWLYMYKRFKDDPYVYRKLVLPVTEMIDYIIEYVEVVEDEGDMPLGDVEYRSWMLGDLLQILSFLPEEEGGRKAVLEFIPTLCLKKKLMDERNCSFVVKLISVCSNIQEENVVTDLVNCVLDSDRPSVRQSTSNSATRSASAVDSLKIEPDDEYSPTALKIELGNLMHRRKKLERDQILAVSEEDFSKAQAYQEDIDALEIEIQRVKASIEANTTMTEDGDDEEDEQWTYTDRTMLIVLSLVKMNILYIDRISPFWRTFLEMYAVKAVSHSKSQDVRCLALELMCMFALEFEEESARTTLYCLMALLKDALNVKITALKCLYDLVLKYSFAKLGGFPEVQGVLMGTNSFGENLKVQVNTEDPASTLKSLLMSYIRHEEVRLVKVCVAGILKLLFKKEMNSSRLISTFLINWAIPSQDAQIRFKDVGTMIPVYANMGENEAVEVAECLLNCIKKILVKMHSRAQGDEIIPHADIDKIVTLIVKSTDPSRLAEFQRCYIAHETIANGALQELRKVDLVTEEKLQYSKLLKVVDLRELPTESVNQMLHLLSEIAEASNRTVSQTLKGFSSYLQNIVVQRGDSIVTMRDETVRSAFDEDTENEVEDVNTTNAN